MTLEKAIGLARQILREQGRIAAIKFLRSLGISYGPARTYVDELRDNALWWRGCK